MKKDRTCVYVSNAEDGALNLVSRTPTGKGSNWVEIVSFD